MHRRSLAVLILALASTLACRSTDAPAGVPAPGIGPQPPPPPPPGPAVSMFSRRVSFSGIRGKDRHTFRGSISIARANPDPNARVACGITGFDGTFTNDDNHFGRLTVLAEVVGPGPFVDEVPIRVSMQFRDDDGKETYDGWVDVGLLVFDRTDARVTDEHLSIGVRRGSGPTRASRIHELAGPGRRAFALMRGFDTRYSGGDHELWFFETGVATHPVGPRKVRVTASSGVRDSSNHWDDRYDGSVHYSLLDLPRGLVAHDRNTLVVDGPDGERSHSAGARRNLSGAFERDEVAAFMTWLHLGFRNKNHHVKQLSASVTAGAQPPGRDRTPVQTSLRARVRDKSQSREFSARAGVLLLGAQGP